MKPGLNSVKIDLDIIFLLSPTFIGTTFGTGSDADDTGM
jgi:hypothetical protein